MANEKLHNDNGHDIEEGDMFMHLPTGKEYQCIYREDQKVWYNQHGFGEDEWFSEDDCYKSKTTKP